MKMASLVDSSGFINLNHIYQIFDDLRAGITYHNNNLLNNDLFWTWELEVWKYRRSNNIIPNIRTIILNKYIPIPLEFLITLFIRENLYTKTWLVVNIGDEMLKILIDFKQYGINILFKYKTSNCEFSFSSINPTPELILGTVYKILYNPVSKSSYNMQKNKQLWIDIIEQFFLTKYLSAYALGDILHYEYHITNQDNAKIDYPFIFDLTKITRFKVPSNTLNYYRSNLEKFIDTVNRRIYNLDVSIRISLLRSEVLVVPNDILESEKVFDENNQPRLNKITIVGINHIYSYIDNVFNSGLYSDYEKMKIACTFKYHPPRLLVDYSIIYKDIVCTLGCI